MSAEQNNGTVRAHLGSGPRLGIQDSSNIQGREKSVEKVREEPGADRKEETQISASQKSR